MASIHKEMMVDASLEEVWADPRSRLDSFALCASRALRLIPSSSELCCLGGHEPIHDVGGMMDQGCAAMRRTLEADNGDDERIN